MRTTETISRPYEIEIAREDGKLVEINIRSLGDAELNLEIVKEAFRSVLKTLGSTTDPAVYDQREDSSDVLKSLADAYNRSGGRITDEYLAWLSVAYDEVSPRRKDVSLVLATAIGKPMPTTKGHIMRARRGGFLTATTSGSRSGNATQKAIEITSQTS